MSYIQINIGGKNRGLKFNQLAFVTFTQYVDTKNYLATAAYAMIYAGLMANCYVKREEPDFDFPTVCEWVDELYNTDPSIITKVDAVFSTTHQFLNLIDKTKEVLKEQTEEEKKNIGTTALSSPADG